MSDATQDPKKSEAETGLEPVEVVVEPAASEAAPGLYLWVQRLSKPWMLVGCAGLLFLADRLVGIPVFMALLVVAAVGCGVAAARHYRRERGGA